MDTEIPASNSQGLPRGGVSADNAALIEKVSDAVSALCWNRNGTALGTVFVSKLKPYLHVVPVAQMPNGCQTACVGTDGVWFAEPFVRRLDPAELVFLAAHEVGHYALGHVQMGVGLGIATEATPGPNGEPGGYVQIPGKEWENQMLGLAQDAFLNEHLLKGGVGRMPEEGILKARLSKASGAESEYDGDLDVEQMYEWLIKNAPRQERESSALNGCVPQGLPGGATPAQADMARADLREHGIGVGSSLADCFAPPPVKYDWRALLADCFDEASMEAADRSERSFARPPRRHPDPDLIMPGLVGTEAHMACLIDCSGSVGPEWVARAVGYIMALGETYPDTKVFVATHTDETVGKAWITPTTDTDTLVKMTGFSGGTDATSAYRDAGEAAIEAGIPNGVFDVLIHFTDTEIGTWPTCPAKRLIVGILGREDPPGVPAHARVVHCTK